MAAELAPLPAESYGSNKFTLEVIMTKPGKRISSKDSLKLQKGKSSKKQKNIPVKQGLTNVVALPLVVGIGASAGGLESFKALFSSTPPDTGMAFVVVQHLDPHHESLMALLLTHHTTMRVIPIEDRMWAEPNHVYVLPPSRSLKIVGGTFYVEQTPEPLGVRTIIDLFFSSLANDKKNKAVGIILSGTGSDGSAGCKAIKDKGGLVIAQDPTTTAFSSMPQNVIASGNVDYVLAPEKIPETLIKHMAELSSDINDRTIKSEEKGKMNFDLILNLLKKATRDDFSSYKKPTLMRRLHKRMEANKIKSFSDYYQFLEKNPSELNLLHADFLIKTTSFFRNPKSFEVLIQKMLPRIISEPDTPLRVWVPGCSTGEEAYSVAILLMEQFSLSNINKKIQIFATDIDEGALNFARRGIYPAKIESHLSTERLARFFEKVEGKYQVKSEVRAKILFVLHNVLRDSPFSKLDLISCRNLFIYLEPEVQKEIIKSFHFALREGGYLFLVLRHSLI